MSDRHAIGTLNSHSMDRFDGGRAPSEPEHCRISELGWPVRPRTDPDEDDVRALALAVMALTTCSG
jgi:hypothetical protein